MQTVGLAACSNGLRAEQAETISHLTQILGGMGKTVRMSECLYEQTGPFSGSGRQRAAALMELYRNPDMTEIYDVSGGDMANEVLDYLDYEVIARSGATFWGYSDLTTVLNAIYARTGKSGVLYQIRHLTDPETGKLQQQRYLNREMLFSPAFEPVQGGGMAGIVVGGNIRCFLKLAGTPYFPDLTGKLLLLEARSGGVPQMVTYLSQLRSCGAFSRISGILLGTFTQMEAEGCKPDIVSLVREAAGRDMPIARTADIGHGRDAKAIRIGQWMSLRG